MCRLYDVGCVLFRTRRIFPHINGPITFCSTSLTCSSISPHAHANFSYFLSGTQPVPGVRMVECGAKEESGKKIRGERGGNGFPRSPPPPPPPPPLFYFAHISFRRPHDLNTWNRVCGTRKKWRLRCLFCKSSYIGFPFSYRLKRKTFYGWTRNNEQ